MKFEKLYVRFEGYPVYNEYWKYEIQGSNPGYIKTEYVCRDKSKRYFLLSKSHFSSKEMLLFQDALTEKVHIEIWQKEYSDYDICDGMSWDIGICCEGQWKWYHGLNSFPEEWPAFRKLLSKYTKTVWPPMVLSTEEVCNFISNIHEKKVQK